MEKIRIHLQNAEKKILLADHLIYKIYPLVKEKTIILKTLSEINFSIFHSINAILHYETLYKRLTISPSPEINLELFIKKCAKRYYLTDEEIVKIVQIISLNKKHSQSIMEFRRGEKIVIISDQNHNLQTEVLDVEKIKSFLSTGRNLFEKAKKGIIS